MFESVSKAEAGLCNVMVQHLPVWTKTVRYFGIVVAYGTRLL